MRPLRPLLAALAALGAPAAAREAVPESAPGIARVAIDTVHPGPVISRAIFGQFAEHIGAGIYGGLWVGPDSPIPNTRGLRNDVVAALRALKVPLVRWPGGCFADIYHWRDGIGPARRARINAHWGGVIEPNTFGIDEYFELLRQIGADAYVNGNVGTAAPAETTEWLEYLTATQGALADERARNGHPAPYSLAYWGIGNELWGCGGRMRAEYAADLTRQFSQFVTVPVGNRPRLVASGPDGPDYTWTETMMRIAGDRIDALALHYYTFPDQKTPGHFGSGTDFDEETYARTLVRTAAIDELLTRHAAIMDRYDPAKRVALDVDEWGVLTDVVPGHPPRSLFMQNSLRDALVAALNFNIFIRHADRVRMSAIAQMVNVAQSMILTRDREMVLTPTYHAFRLYSGFQDAVALPVRIETGRYAVGEWSLPAVDAVAGRGKDGIVHVALTNVDAARAERVTIDLGEIAAKRVVGQILTADAVTAHNDFGSANAVAPRPFTAARGVGGRLEVELPAHSLVVLDLRGG